MNVVGSTVCSPRNVPSSSNGCSYRLAHQPALESTVDRELDAADSAATRRPRPGVCPTRRARGRPPRVAAGPQQRVHAHRQHTAALHLLQQPILVDRDARVADRRQTGGVQLLIFGDAIVDPLVERPRARRAAASPGPWRGPPARRSGVHPGTARCGRRPARGVCSSIFHRRQRGGIDDVLVTAANEHDGRASARPVSRSSRSGKRCSRSCASCQSLLDTTIPPARRVAHTRGDGRQHLADRSRAREIDAGPPPALWRWLSIKPGTTVRPSRPRWRSTALRAGEMSAVLPTAMKRPSAIATPRRSKTRIDGHNSAVHENQVCLRLGGLRRRGGRNRRADERDDARETQPWPAGNQAAATAAGAVRHGGNNRGHAAICGHSRAGAGEKRVRSTGRGNPKRPGPARPSSSPR